MTDLDTRDTAIRERAIALLEQVCALDPDVPTIGNRKANEEYARKLREWIDQGERLFRSAPENVDLNLLFAPETGPLHSPEQVEAMAQQMMANYETLRTALDALRERCSLIIRDRRLGEHGAAGFRQEQAARAARELCELADRPLAWSSSTSAYRKVARNFYEAMTGQSGHDMERACRRMADRKT